MTLLVVALLLAWCVVAAFVALGAGMLIARAEVLARRREPAVVVLPEPAAS